MSKASRRRQRPGTNPATSRPASPPPTPSQPTGPTIELTSTGATGASRRDRARAARRGLEDRIRRDGHGRRGWVPAQRQQRRAASVQLPHVVQPGRPPRAPAVVHQPSFMERYRTAIVVVAALAGVALISVFVFFSASQAGLRLLDHLDAGPDRVAVARGHARARLRPAGHGPPARRRRREGDLHLLRPGVGQRTSTAGRRRADPGPRLRPERQRHPAGLDPQPRARRPGRALPEQQRRRDAEGQAQLRGVLRRLPARPVCGTPKGAIGPVIARFDQM